MKNYKTYQTLIFCFGLLVLISCGRDQDLIVEPDLIDQIDGLVQNRVDGSGIKGVTINMNRKENEILCFSSCTPNISFSSTKTDDNGSFQFRGFGNPPEGYSHNLSVAEIPEGYQNVVWINGEMPTLFKSNSRWRFGLNSTSLLEVLYEYYPRTYFNLHFTNVEPASDDDILEFNVNNAWIYPAGIEKETSFAFVGIHDDAQIGGETELENILTIEYQVTTDEGTETFSKTVECLPGGMTEIEIEY
jgi:hypothetical protein